MVERPAESEDRPELEPFVVHDIRAHLHLAEEEQHRAASERKERSERRVDPERSDVRDHGRAERIARHPKARQMEMELVREHVREPEERAEAPPRKRAHEVAAL